MSTNGLMPTESTPVRFEESLQKAMSFFGSAKFAVLILVITIETIVFGSLIRYAFGSQAAMDLVFNSWFQRVLMACICLSLLASIGLRFPLKVGHAGFVAVHLSIVIIIVSGIVTSLYRVDEVVSAQMDQPSTVLRSGVSPVSIELLNYRIDHYPGTSITLSEQADVNLKFNDSSSSKHTVSSAKAFSHMGWRVSLLGPDGAGAIRFGLMKDPGVPFLYTGCWMLLAGVCILLWASLDGRATQRVPHDSREAQGGRVARGWMPPMVFGLIVFALIFARPALTPSQIGDGWKGSFADVPLQYQGRVMPLDSYARIVASELTGSTHWPSGHASELLAGRDHLDLFADLLFRHSDLFDEPVVLVANYKLKARLGLALARDHFSAAQLMENDSIHQLSVEIQSKMISQHGYRPSSLEVDLMDSQRRITLLVRFPESFRKSIGAESIEGQSLVDMDTHGDMVPDNIQAAFSKLESAYLGGVVPNGAASELAAAMQRHWELQGHASNAVALELVYNYRSPWKMAMYANWICLLFIVVWAKYGHSWLRLCTGVCIVWSISEQLLGHYLRFMFLGHIPVSNTYEVLLWIGLIAILLGAVGGLRESSKACVLAGVGACQLCLLLSMFVPIADQTGVLPAVLRSNYWIVVHVLTIVSSFGFMLLAAVMAHIYLLRSIVLPQSNEISSRVLAALTRSMQGGVILLTAGTILGGVWAAESWGRFWGWDPKESWSLVVIVFYVCLFHAKYADWIRGFGLAVGAIAGFACVIWTFYGVNYVTGSSIHSYGSGSGGHTWLYIWFATELFFVSMCAARNEFRTPHSQDSTSSASQ